MGTATVRVVVHNVAPVVSATGGTAQEGSDFTLAAAFSDPGGSDRWVVQVDYGDGSAVETRPLSGAGPFTVHHRYADNGTYLVTLTVLDDDGGIGTATVPVEVLNVAPSFAGLSGGRDIPEGSAYTGLGRFLDPGADTWTVTVDYGDGSALERFSLLPGSGNTFALSHVYDDGGLYTLRLTLTDDEGGTATATLSTVIVNVAPTVTASNDSPRYWGMPVHLVGSATDPSQADTQAGFTAHWSLGDGAAAPGLTTAHVYAAPGTYAAVLRVTDKDGGTGEASTALTVQQRPGTVACEDLTAVFGFPAALRGRFVDALPGGLPGGRSLRFRLGMVDLGASTTDALGLAGVQGPEGLAPGSYPLTVSFAGDSHYAEAEARCTLTLIQSNGTVTGGGLRLSNNARGGFNVQFAEGGSLQGELQFQSDTTAFHAHTMTALGLSEDGRRGWFAGVGRDGSAFTAYVEDNGEPGASDVFKLWIGGVPQTGDGALLAGNIQFH
jgi:PKD repeat protein